jgi:ABC-type oligopeptide transport system ATPase subunit
MLEPGRYTLDREGGLMRQGSLVFDVQNVSKTFPLAHSIFSGLRRRTPTELKALSEVSVQIRRGEVFGLIGESGSGKSTLGYLLGGIEEPTSGSVTFCDTPLHAMSRQERRRFRQQTQIVFQDSGSALNPRRKVGSTLRDSLRLAGVPRSERTAGLRAILQMVGLAVDHAIRFPHQLSGGQRQRVGIARALAMKPDVLIADEPVSALDVSVQAQIINLLLDLRRELDLTIVLISHDIGVVAHATDRVAVMRGGEIVETGPTAEVIHAPKHPYTRALISAVPKGLRQDLQAT